RVYKIQAASSLPVHSRSNLFLLSASALVDLLGNPNEYFPRRARELLAERRDKSVLPRLKRQIFNSTNAHLQLESLWAFYVSGGFNEQIAAKLLQHPNPNIRKWTIRFLG